MQGKITPQGGEEADPGCGQRLSRPTAGFLNVSSLFPTGHELQCTRARTVQAGTCRLTRVRLVSSFVTNAPSPARPPETHHTSLPPLLATDQPLTRSTSLVWPG